MSSRRVFKEELMNYFRDYKERVNTDSGERIRSYYSGFKTEKFEKKSDFGAPIPEKQASWIDFKVRHSVLDDIVRTVLHNTQKKTAHQPTTGKT